MALVGFFSIIYITIHSPYLLSLCIGHNSESTDHMIQIKCYLLYSPEKWYDHIMPQAGFVPGT